MWLTYIALILVIGKNTNLRKRYRDFTGKWIKREDELEYLKRKSNRAKGNVRGRDITLARGVI